MKQKQPKCVTNPRTKKPYSRHLWGPVDVRVATYSLSYGGYAPYSYSFKHTCKRCGLTNQWS